MSDARRTPSAAVDRASGPGRADPVTHQCRNPHHGSTDRGPDTVVAAEQLQCGVQVRHGRPWGPRSRQASPPAGVGGRPQGAERIIYSEDFPYIVRDNVSDFLEQAELTDDQRNAIAHRNAENVMRIKAT